MTNWVRVRGTEEPPLLARKSHCVKRLSTELASLLSSKGRIGKLIQGSVETGLQDDDEAGI